jgi:hypothetical protein
MNPVQIWSLRYLIGALIRWRLREPSWPMLATSRHLAGVDWLDLAQRGDRIDDVRRKLYRADRWSDWLFVAVGAHDAGWPDLILRSVFNPESVSETWVVSRIDAVYASQVRLYRSLWQFADRPFVLTYADPLDDERDAGRFPTGLDPRTLPIIHHAAAHWARRTRDAAAEASVPVFDVYKRWEARTRGNVRGLTAPWQPANMITRHVKKEPVPSLDQRSAGRALLVELLDEFLAQQYGP